MTDLSYPIGRFEYRGKSSPEERRQAIDAIIEAPERLREALAGLGPAELDTPYRPGGWTVRQVAHHLPESHMNGYIRTKLALTEEGPTIKPYDEARWSALPDALTLDPTLSVTLLEAVHRRWVPVLAALTPADLERTYRHPEYGHTFTLDEQLGLYAWHGRHHVAHITSLRQRRGW